MQYTKKCLDAPLVIRKRKGETLNGLGKKMRLDDELINYILTEAGDLIYPDEAGSAYGKKYYLTFKGETIAQAEFDRRFDMYYTRTISFVALLTSIAAIIITAA